MTKTPPQPKPKPAADDDTQPAPASAEYPPGYVPNLEGVDKYGDPGGPLNVYQALAWVQDQLTAVGKNRQQSGPGPKFSFRGIDDVYNALHPLLGQAGLLITGQAESFHTEDHYWSKGSPKEKVESKAVVMVRFRVFASDGSKLPKSLCPLVPAEGVDNSDKGSGKAWSYAYKTAISSMFSLPTDDPAHDNEQRLQADVESGWWDLWPTKAAHDDFRSDNISIMRKLKQTNPDGLEEVKQWMETTGLMVDGRVISQVAKEAMAAWSDRLSLAVSNRAESSDAEPPAETPSAETTPEDSSDGQTTNLHEMVTAALTEHGPMTEAEIAEELKTPAAAVRAAIMGLSQMGSITSEDDLWDLTQGEDNG